MLAITSRTLDGPLSAGVAAFSFATSLLLTGALGWWADRLTRDRERRRVEELTEIPPAAGVH